MNINATTPYSQNFQARIKMNKPNLKVLAQSAIGTGALASGAAAIAEGSFSANAVFNVNPYSIESIPKNVVDSHAEILTSAGHGYDAAGDWGGVPSQSTVAPIGLSAGGTYLSNLASNAYKKVLDEDDVKAFSDSSAASLANKSTLYSLSGTSYLGTAAASLYSGFNGDVLEHANQALPHAVQSHPGYPEPYEYGDEPTGSYVGQSIDSSAVSGVGSVGLPLAAGISDLLSKASDTKSSQFVADTLSDGKTDKKLPS